LLNFVNIFEYVYAVILLKLTQALEERGRTAYWLAQNSGVPYYSIWRLVRNETQRSINLSVLSRIVSALDCEITDILEYEEDDEDSAIRAQVKRRDRKK
jgi:DNA-binding Xre family transcriptional regulator